MNVSVQIPDSIVLHTGLQQEEISQSLLEAFAVQNYRARRLTSFQVGQLLGHSSRWETDEFLKKNECYGYTEKDLETDRKTLDDLLEEDI